MVDKELLRDTPSEFTETGRSHQFSGGFYWRDPEIPSRSLIKTNRTYIFSKQHFLSYIYRPYNHHRRDSIML